MGVLSAKLRSADGGFFHWCPGCELPHRVNVTKDNLPKWKWDGNVDRPTVSPSIRCFTTVDGEGEKLPNNGERTLCHYHLKDGVIEFCGDCEHGLSGQAVPLPDFPANYGTP